MESPASGAPPVPTPAGREGCARNVLIGCGVLALVVLAVLVGFFMYVRRNPAFMTDLMMKQIESHYGSDVTEQDKADLRSAYQEFRAAVNEKRINRSGVDRLQMTFSSSRANQLDREQVHALTRAFREAASGAPSAPAPSTSPVPEPSRSP